MTELLSEHGEPTTFDFTKYVSEKATVPDDSVVVYLDAKTAYEIDRLKADHDEWQKNPGARSITEMADVDERLEAMQEKIKESALTFHMRAVGEPERRVLQEAVRRDYPLHKSATEDERETIDAQRYEATLNSWVGAAITKVVTPEGAESRDKFDREKVADLRNLLHVGEWQKLVRLVNELSFNESLIDRAVDAGFPGGGTLET